jgi:hypothetical protein
MINSELQAFYDPMGLSSANRPYFPPYFFQPMMMPPMIPSVSHLPSPFGYYQFP